MAAVQKKTQEDLRAPARHSLTLRQWMERSGWTEERLAEYCGVRFSTIHRWKNGVQPRARYMNMLADLSQDTIDPGSYARLAGEVERALESAHAVG